MEISSRLNKGWFSEACDMWPGISISLEVEKTLYSGESAFQKIEVFETRHHGRMLVLDGIIQLTEKDEFAYHEMMSHLPLMCHPDPKDVLVIGGGDGGILREVARHDTVRTIDFCEIDKDVIEVSKRFLPGLACGFDDSRVRVHIEDGVTFVRKEEKAWDLIIVDSSDPVGPGVALFEAPFYQGMRQALKPDGIIAAQGESFFLHPEEVMNLVRINRALFSAQACATVIVPTYLGGHINISLASLGPEFGRPARQMAQELQDRLRYYSPSVHRAAFALPYFAEKMMEDAKGR